MSLESTERADALASDLGEAIADLPVYRKYEEARRAVQESDELQAEIEEFEQLRRAYAADRQAGEATREQAEAVQRAQQRLHSRPAMADYLEAREALVARLEELNRAVSGPLSVDFGGEAGGCCQD